MPTIEQIKTDIYGSLYAPGNFLEFVVWLERFGVSVGSGIWRGQSHIGWKVQNAAARRIKVALDSEYAHDLIRGPETFEEKVRVYEQRLLNEARSRDLGFKNGRNLTELELLACLQHY